jgi:SAM-dependent methyltransferase
MQRSFATFAPQLPDRGCVIEVGTGAGDFLKPFMRAGYRARGFEPSPDSAARARAAGVEVVAEFATDDPATREALESADLVVSNHSLEHHYDPNRLLSLCARYMKPGTMLGITVPNAETEFLLMTHLFMLHLDSYTPISLEGLLNKHGFRVVDREIGGQLRFLAVKDPNISQPASSASRSEAEIRSRYRNRFLSQLPATETFSIKGARPFRGLNYEVCGHGEYGSRTLSVQTQIDGGDTIRYATSAPDKAVLVLK